MDVIKTRLIGDAAPDIFYLDSFEAPLLMKYGVLEPLNSYITKQFDLEDFQPAPYSKLSNWVGKPMDCPKTSRLSLFSTTKSF
jgi:multiple sugar transport system substrate-binding protein